VTVDLRGERDLGEIVGYAYRLYFANFVALFLIALITAPLQMLAAVISRQFDDSSAAAGAVFWIFLAPTFVVGLVASAALVYAVHGITDGVRPEPMAALDAAFARIGGVLSSGLLALALIVLALVSWPFMLLRYLLNRRATIDGRRDWWVVAIPFVLGPFLAVRWQFVPQAVMIDGRERWPALDTSALLVRGAWWRVFGIIIVITMIQLGPVALGSLFAAAPPLVEATVTSLVGALVLPFAVIAQTLLYYDLKARKHAAIGPA
jgi:hypothetical protein